MSIIPELMGFDLFFTLHRTEHITQQGSNWEHYILRTNAFLSCSIFSVLCFFKTHDSSHAQTVGRFSMLDGFD